MVTLQFHATENSIDNTVLEVYANTHEEIYIKIYNSKDSYDYQFITLDKESAIKLTKELKKQISFI